MDGYLKKPKQTLAMLKGDTKRIVPFLFLAAVFFSCNSLNQDNGSKADLYVRDKFSSYNEIYAMLKDSINRYIDSSLTAYLSPYSNNWQVDSLLIIDSKVSRLVATINVSNGIGKEQYSDVIIKSLGKKIDDKWYFFIGGGSLTVPRDMYGKDAMHPLSFHELSQIARENSLASALIKDENGNYIVNDAWVEKHFYNKGYGNFSSRAAYDSVHWKIILDKWKHKIDTNEYKPLNTIVKSNKFL